MEQSTYFCITETGQSTVGGAPSDFPQVTLPFRPASVNRVVKIKSIYLWERYLSTSGQRGSVDGAQIVITNLNSIRDSISLNPFIVSFGKDKSVLKNMDIEVVMDNGAVNMLYTPYIFNSFAVTPVVGEIINVVACVEIYV